MRTRMIAQNRRWTGKKRWIWRWSEETKRARGRGVLIQCLWNVLWKLFFFNETFFHCNCWTPMSPYLIPYSPITFLDNDCSRSFIVTLVELWLHLIEHLITVLDEPLVAECSLISFDFFKNFNSISHVILIHKLEDSRLPGSMNMFISLYLDNMCYNIYTICWWYQFNIVIALQAQKRKWRMHFLSWYIGQSVTTSN